MFPEVPDSPREGAPALNLGGERQMNPLCTETRQGAPESCWEPQNVSLIGWVWCRRGWGGGWYRRPQGALRSRPRRCSLHGWTAGDQMSCGHVMNSSGNEPFQNLDMALESLAGQ